MCHKKSLLAAVIWLAYIHVTAGRRLPENYAAAAVRDNYIDALNGNYGYGYDNINGISAYEDGYIKNPKAEKKDRINAKRGCYSYSSPEGAFISVIYTADERGYRPDTIITYPGEPEHDQHLASPCGPFDSQKPTARTTSTTTASSSSSGYDWRQEGSFDQDLDAGTTEGAPAEREMATTDIVTKATERTTNAVVATTLADTEELATTVSPTTLGPLEESTAQTTLADAIAETKVAESTLATTLSDAAAGATTGATTLADAVPETTTGATNLGDADPETTTGATTLADALAETTTIATTLADSIAETTTIGATETTTIAATSELPTVEGRADLTTTLTPTTTESATTFSVTELTTEPWTTTTVNKARAEVEFTTETPTTTSSPTEFTTVTAPASTTAAKIEDMTISPVMNENESVSTDGVTELTTTEAEKTTTDSTQLDATATTTDGAGLTAMPTTTDPPSTSIRVRSEETADYDANVSITIS